MRKLSTEKRAMILSALVEGMSINGVARMCSCSKITVLRLLADVGQFCADYHDLTVRGLKTKRAQVDELWAYCGCKERQRKLGAQGYGDVWTWVGLDADSKLAISYLVGKRDRVHAHTFMRDLAERLTGRIQLTTDAFKAYPDAVEVAFVGEVDYAQIHKIYRSERAGPARYSPPTCTGCERKRVLGAPDMAHVSTSYIERQNLTVRMGLRRYTRLTNAFSKSIQNHIAAVSLHYFHYNFIRKHMTLKTTPAVAAGIASRPLTILDLVHMVEKEEKALGGRLTSYLPAT